MRVLFIGFFAIAVLVYQSNLAVAHSFSVVLAMSATQPDKKAIHQGFSLAAKENDGHPDETADGHLGGLDVFIYDVDLEKPKFLALRSILTQKPIDIVVVFGSKRLFGQVFPVEKNTNAVMIGSAKNSFRSLPLSVISGQTTKSADFISAFKSAYKNKPSALAAQGYNAAKRIASVVRLLAGISPKKSLRDGLLQSENYFN